MGASGFRPHIGRRLTSITLTFIALAGGTAAPGADWSEALGASAHAAYVTNPQFVPHSSLADESGVLTLDDVTTAKTERGQLTVTPRLSITRYHRERSLDIDAGSLDLGYRHQLERGQWTFSAHALTDSTVTSELGLTGATGVNLRHEAGTASTGYTYFATERLSWLLQGSWQTTRYRDAQQFGLTDYDSSSVQLGPSWSFSERLLGSIFVGADRTSPKNGTTQNDYPVNVQLKRSLSERYAWRASMGVTRVESGPGNSGRSSLFELGASRQSERLQWDASIRRAVAPIGFGFLTRQDQGTLNVVAATSARSSLSISLNVLRSQPLAFLHFLVYGGASWEQAGAEWQYRLSPKWMVSAAYTYARARSGELLPWATGNQARLGVVWNSGRL